MTDPLLARLDPRDFAEVARLVLPTPTLAWVESGGGPDSANQAAFARRRFLPHALVDVRDVALATTLLGRPAAMPIGIAPIAAQRSIHPEGEAATARAAQRSGIVCIV